MVQQVLALFWNYRSPESIRFDRGCTLALLALFFVVLNMRRRTGDLTRREATGIGAFWTLYVSLQYWALGPYSFTGLSEEAIGGVPWFVYLTKAFVGGSFAHSWSGGTVTDGAMVLGIQFIGVERLLFLLLPSGGAVFVMKAGAVAIAYAGTYRLARSGMALSRSKAVVLAMLAGVGSMLNLGFVLCGNGWGFALLPLAFYTLCVRSDRPRYFLWVTAFSVAFSSSTSVIHQLPMTMTALALSALVLPPKNFPRCLGGLALLAVVSILNWAGILSTIVQLAPESFRVISGFEPVESVWLKVLLMIREHADIYVFPIGIFALATLAFFRDRRLPWAAMAVAGTVLIGPVIYRFDWSWTGISLLSAYRWDQLSHTDSLPITVVLGLALQRLNWKRIRLWKFFLPPPSTVYLLAFIFWASADLKYEDWDRYRSWGGLAHLQRPEILSRTDWRPAEPFRLVSVGESVFPNLPNASGLDSLDGESNVYTTRSSYFFGYAVEKRDLPMNSSWHRVTLPRQETRLSTTTDLDALRVANVRFVFTDRPLADPELKLVVSQQGAAEGAEKDSVFRSASRKLAPAIYARTLYLYELPNPWPRVFVPGAIRVSKAPTQDRAFYREITASKSPQAVLAAADVAEFGLRTGTWSPAAVHLRSFKVVPSGFDVELETISHAPGVLIFNVPYSRFWRARSGDKGHVVFPVNGVQTGVVVNGVADRLELRYSRAGGN